MVPKPKAYSSKKYQKVHGIVSKKFELYWSKAWKNDSQMKIVRVQKWYVYIQLLDDQTQKDF